MDLDDCMEFSPFKEAGRKKNIGKTVPEESIGDGPKILHKFFT